jgi:hypothetical protein
MRFKRELDINREDSIYNVLVLLGEVQSSPNLSKSGLARKAGFSLIVCQLVQKGYIWASQVVTLFPGSASRKRAHAALENAAAQGGA